MAQSGFLIILIATYREIEVKTRLMSRRKRPVLLKRSAGDRVCSTRVNFARKTTLSTGVESEPKSGRWNLDEAI